MNSSRYLTTMLAMIALVAELPWSSYSRQNTGPLVREASTPENCNQPLPQPIMRVPTSKAFSVTATRNGCWIFVGVNSGPMMEVLRRDADRVTRVRAVNIRGAFLLRLTHDEKVLIAAAQSQITFFDVGKLISGSGNPVLGYIADRRIAGATTLAITSDDLYVFANQSFLSWIAIIDLQKARATGYSADAITGGFPVGLPSMGFKLSPDERYLYVNSQDALGVQPQQAVCTGAENTHPLPGPHPRSGLVVIDVEKAKVGSSTPVIAAVGTGCSANQLAISPDGDRAYLGVSEPKGVLAFDLRPVKRGLPPELIGRVPMEPTHLITTRDGTRVIVASSNQDKAGKGTLAVIDAMKVGQGASAILGVIPTRGQPFGMHLAADGRTLLVAAEGLEVIDLDRVELQR